MEPTRRIPANVARDRARRAAALLSRNPRVRLVYLFGSAADERRTEVRDVDLAVLADPPLSFTERVRMAGELASEVGGEVDLVSIPDAPILLAWEIADSGRCLFARDPGEETDFVTRARLRYWDFKPFLDEQSRLIAQRRRERLGGPQT